MQIEIFVYVGERIGERISAKPKLRIVRLAILCAYMESVHSLLRAEWSLTFNLRESRRGSSKLVMPTSLLWKTLLDCYLFVKFLLFSWIKYGAWNRSHYRSWIWNQFRILRIIWRNIQNILLNSGKIFFFNSHLKHPLYTLKNSHFVLCFMELMDLKILDFSLNFQIWILNWN